MYDPLTASESPDIRPLTPEAATVIARWPRSRAEAVMFGGPALPWPLTAEDLWDIHTSTAWTVLVAHGRFGVPAATGSLVLKQRGTSARIGRVLVDPELRGQRWGRCMMEALIARAEAVPSVEQLELGVYRHNVAARSLYERLGFVATGETRESGPDGETWVNLQMERRLSRSRQAR